MAVFHTQIEGKALELLEATLHSMGYEVVRIKNFQMGRRKTLQLMIERLDGNNISVEDCEVVSRQSSAMFDTAELMSKEYNLEVSSPGLNRPLTRLKDFTKFIGQTARVVLYQPIDERRKFVGIINNVESEDIILEVEELKSQVRLKFDNIEEAFLQYNINSTRK